MTDAQIRKAYADDVRMIADRIEDGALARDVQSMTPMGEMVRVLLPEGYPCAPGGAYTNNEV